MLKPAIKQAPTARRKQASGGRDRGGGMEGFSSGPISGDYINVKKIAKWRDGRIFFWANFWRLHKCKEDCQMQ